MQPVSFKDIHGMPWVVNPERVDAVYSRKRLATTTRETVITVIVIGPREIEVDQDFNTVCVKLQGHTPGY